MTSLADGQWTWTVTAQDTGGKALGSASGTFTVDGSPHGTVVIDGSGRIGTLMSTTSLIWDKTGVTSSYQWYRGTTPISGQTSSTYRLADVDLGKEVWLRVTGKRAGFFDGTVDSNHKTGSVRPTLQPSTKPSFTGQARCGLLADRRSGSCGPPRRTRRSPISGSGTAWPSLAQRHSPTAWSRPMPGGR